MIVWVLDQWDEEGPGQILSVAASKERGVELATRWINSQPGGGLGTSWRQRAGDETIRWDGPGGWHLTLQPQPVIE